MILNDGARKSNSSQPRWGQIGTDPFCFCWSFRLHRRDLSQPGTVFLRLKPSKASDDDCLVTEFEGYVREHPSPPNGRRRDHSLVYFPRAAAAISPILTSLWPAQLTPTAVPPMWVSVSP